MSVALVVSLLVPATLAAWNSSGTPTFSQPAGYQTKVYNVSAATTTISYAYTDEELAMLWNQVGDIEIGPITTTVEPTPEPSAYPSPGVFHPLVASSDPSLESASLPNDFVWGIAASSYQIEGAAKDEGKGPSIWDLLAHRNYGSVSDNSTGDIVGSHYWLYKQDFARLAKLGVPYFSPSFSWPRFFPFGNGPLNQEGVKHYDDVIANMVSNGIKPAVTLFHWDTPLALFNSYGAWTDPKIIDDFFNYAKFVITRYDAYVPIWYTFNEPQYCNWQYQYYPAGNNKGIYPAYHNITGGLSARIACSHYTILAHAKVAKWYHEEFKGRGRITFKNSGNYYEGNSTSTEDLDAVARNYEFVLGWFNGCWRDGDYSPMIKETLGSLLPNFTQAEKDLIKGSCDFFAIDAYTGYLATAVSGGSAACAANSSHPAFPECASSSSLAADGFPLGPSADNEMSWLYSTPVGIRRFLNVITKDLFPTVPDIVVSEFGFAEPFEGQQTKLENILWDLRRSDYYQGFLDNILLAKTVDRVNVTGIFAWSIFDNFEWFSGNQVKFGVQYLNATSMERVPKASLFQMLNWFKTKGGATHPGVGGNATAAR
ncbi:(Trans)glycosidase [Glarea lozoyensis ATCC 20868]|uniref:(Trans)glycosidase n=1 Tax=Glarea lozoyensis (strain ATCC 20868 / MF5171) TaxID=1116229 RepID=S3CS85_GLAL2|nr:(Trans)glycosidase [Glarea lozoyensis ATCC 20868]EPE27929.1 (Trans)glycosidase [Glarea lozoyensis ATCC 20868]